MEQLRQRIAKVKKAFMQISHWFASRIHGIRLIVILAAVVWLAFGLMAISFSGLGTTSEVGTGGLPLSVSDLSAVPQSVAEDAVRLATELFGDSQEKCDSFVNQLLATYSKAEDKDFIILFNPGGWGWNPVEHSPEWWSISTGVKSELDSSGYASLVLNYQRTLDTLRGHLNELVEMMTGYSSKAKDLACRVEFLTSHNADLKIILAGESNGAIICDRAMSILEDNPQVYSIQTGPPFWHKNAVLDRTLVLTDNGIIPDSFSQGDFPTMIWANLKSVLGLSKSEDSSGKILRYVEAPGHQYRWQYPEVYSQIRNFLDENFKTKW